MSGQPPHQLVSDDHLHKCVCEDWHPGSFFVEAARPELLPAADPDDFVLEGYEPSVDDFGTQYLARSDRDDICHHCGQQMIGVKIGPEKYRREL